MHGCDSNRRLVDWVQKNLPFVEARRNERTPPLPYRDGSFDFVYAISIFTHLSTEQASAWMAEIKRVLRPGGLFFFTTHGVSYRDQLSAEDLETFDRGRPVVRFTHAEGTNLCGAFHPRRFVESTLAKEFEVVEAIETHTIAEDLRNLLRQDRYLVRKP